MSKVNLESVQNGTERLQTELKELLQFTSSQNVELSKHLTDLKYNLTEKARKTEQLSESITTEETKKRVRATELEELNTELQKLNHHKDILVSEISSQQKDIEQLSSIILEKEKSKTEISIAVDSLTQRTAEQKRKIEEHEVLIDAINEDFTKDSLKKDTIYAQISNQYNSMISKSKALKFLVKKDIVILPEIKVIRSLKVPGMDSELNIRKTSGVSDQIIRNILLDLDKREIISFDPLSGKVQILDKIDI
ncbi:MAG: hypothetical protein KAS95_07220 [Candidatus Heimdallarchaeota archaeon]|nr:hypothetical protein [Candidatus Heimdallarchaeota archaeon]